MAQSRKGGKRSKECLNLRFQFRSLWHRITRKGNRREFSNVKIRFPQTSNGSGKEEGDSVDTFGNLMRNFSAPSSD